MNALQIALLAINVASLILVGFLLVIYTDGGFNFTTKIAAWILLAVTRPTDLVRYFWLRSRGKIPRIRA